MIKYFVFALIVSVVVASCLLYIVNKQERLVERIAALESVPQIIPETTFDTDIVYLKELILENSARTNKVIDLLDSLTHSHSRLLEIKNERR